MLTKDEAKKIDEYLMKHYTLSDKDHEYLDDIDILILECSLSSSLSDETLSELLETANSLQRKMNALFILDDGCSPRVLAYQEKYYTVLYLYKKGKGESAIPELAMQSFTSSFDLFWLRTVANMENDE